MVVFGIFCFVSVIVWWYSWWDFVFLELVVLGDLISIVWDEGQFWMGLILMMKLVVVSGIMINNFFVVFGMVVGGVVVGLWIIYVLFYNGLLLGVVGILVV